MTMADWEWSEQHITECACGGAGWLNVHFSSEHGDRIQTVPCICKVKERKRRWADRLREWANVPVYDRQFTLDNWDPDKAIVESRKQREQICVQYRRVCQYAESPDGWLLLSGPVGCGKTHLARGVAGHVWKRGGASFVATAAQILQMIRDSYDNDFSNESAMRSKLNAIDLLVIDDLGVERHPESGWVNEKLFTLINDRYETGKPCMVTTNCTLGELRKIEGPRIVSRMSERATVLLMRAGDYRLNR